jgi:xylulokinase
MSDPEAVLVAVDVGTSGARAAAFDLAGERLLEVRRGYPTATPRPGWAEQSAADWRSAALGSLAGLVRQLGPRRPVLAISLTGQCPSVVLVDARGRPVGPGLIYRDNRATAEAAALRRRLGDATIHARTGHRPAAFHVGPKLAWLRHHEPDAWRRAALALQPRDLVALALTGEAVTDGTHAAATLGYDLRARRWDEALLDTLGLPASLFPRLARSDEVVGSLRPAIAGRLGLPASTPVVLGGADSQACAFGAGVVEAGPVSEMAGSSTCLNAAVTQPLANLAVTHYPHVVGDGYTTETGINTTGSVVAWVADRWYGGRTGRATGRDYVRLDREAATVAAGADGVRFVPVLADGERTDPRLRGAITGLSLRHDRATVVRAALEGVAYAIRAQLELLADDGVPLTELRVSGGDARLATWNRVKADVTGLPVRRVPGDAAVAGVAMLAGIGAGVYRDRADAIARCVRPDPPIEPDPRVTGIHADGYAAWRALVASAAVHDRGCAPRGGS